METERRITRAHMRSIFNLLSEKKLFYYSNNLCMMFSNNRTGDDFELTLPEAQKLIKFLKSNSTEEIINTFLITPDQKKFIHTLLSKMSLMKYKGELCANYSCNRTTHSSELTQVEANELIHYLKSNDECEVMIKRIWHLGYTSKIIYGDTKADLAINAAKLDMFLKQRGSVKKPLRQQNMDELNKTLIQFKSIASKAYEKQVVSSYILHLETEIQKCISCENYEKAQKLKQSIEAVKSNSKIAIAFYKKKNKNKIEK